MILKTKITNEFLPDFNDLKENYEIIHELINAGKVLAVSSIRQHGIADTIFKMCVGNKIGFKFTDNTNIFNPMFGSFIVELKEECEVADKLELLGETISNKEIKLSNGETLDLEELIRLWEEPLEKVFPTRFENSHSKIENIVSEKTCNIVAKNKFAKPRVLITAFPGTNSEYDSAKVFEDAGGNSNIIVFRNLRKSYVEESIKAFAKAIKESQIVMIPGGFSAGDEPDGSGKFIATVYRNPRIKEAIHEHLKENDGLMLGICNGFQSLIKLGLVPYGEIVDMKDDMPTLTFNTIARHQAKFVTTKVTSKLSPWFNKVSLGDEFVIPISHGEGKFVANTQVIDELIANGQIASQYVDMQSNATYDINCNPNNSIYAIEAITSADGRVLGKMSHPERSNRSFVKNIPGNMDQKLFEAGIEYFT